MKPITFSACFLGIHSRAKEWVFVGEGKCDQELRCSRCGHGLGQSRASHDFADWQYVAANECAQVRTCRRCGCEQTRLYHDCLYSRTMETSAPYVREIKPSGPGAPGTYQSVEIITTTQYSQCKRCPFSERSEDYTENVLEEFRE